MPSSTDVPSTESTDLMVASRIIGCECASANKAFLLCKSNDRNPKACVAQGEKVTACVLGVLRNLEKNCNESFNNYKKAMDKNWHQFDLVRKEQHAMEDCWRKFKNPQASEAEANES